MSTIRSVDRILVFAAGRIVEEGAHETLMLRPGGIYRRLVEMQAFGVPDDAEPEQRDAG